MGATVKAATLAVDVTARGVARAMAGLKSLEEYSVRLQRHLKGSAEGVIKLWAAFLVLSNTSVIASSYFQQFGAILGAIIDEILLPITPILDAIVDGLWAFVDWFTGQGPVVKAAALAIAVAFGLMWLGLTGPIAIVIAAVAAAVYLILTHWDAIKAGFDALVAFLLGLARFLRDAMLAAWTLLAGTVMAVVQRLWDALRAGWNGLVGAVMGVVGSLASWLTGAWDRIAAIAIGAAAAVRHGIESLWSGLVGTVSSIWSAVAGAIGGAISTIVGWLQGLWNWIQPVINGLNQLAGLVGGGLGALGSLFGVGGRGGTTNNYSSSYGPFNFGGGGVLDQGASLLSSLFMFDRRR